MRRHAVHSDGARLRRVALFDHDRQPGEGRHSARHKNLPAGRTGPAVRLRPGLRAWRREAREHPPGRQREREARRLRPRGDAEGHERNLGHSLLHIPGEGQEGANRLPCGHVLSGRHPLPRSYGRCAVRGRRLDSRGETPFRRRPEEAKRASPRDHARHRRPRDEDAGLQEGGPLSQLRGVA